MFKRLFSGAIIFGLAAAAPPAVAQSHCGVRDLLVERLSTTHDEELAGAGLQCATRLVELWASPETGSWTILVTRADGKACVLAVGENWQIAPPRAPAPHPSEMKG